MQQRYGVRHRQLDRKFDLRRVRRINRRRRGSRRHEIDQWELRRRRHRQWYERKRPRCLRKVCKRRRRLRRHHQNDNSTSGVYGTAGNGWGLFGESSDTSGDYTAIAGVGDASATSLFVVVNTKTGGNCTIDPTANLACSGSVSGSAVHVRQRNSSGRHVLSYAAQSASATIEDVGTARMIDGVANVQISPDFASVTDRGWYYVFLTPLGDTRGLYVSVKTANAFQVRETLRGRNSLAFDYRIVAHPLGAPQDRLPAAPSRPAFARLIHPAL